MGTVMVRILKILSEEVRKATAHVDLGPHYFRLLRKWAKRTGLVRAG